MKKMIFSALVLVAFVACGKKNDDRDPVTPIRPKSDNQQVQDTKKAAQENSTPPTAASENNSNSEKTATSTPAPNPSTDGNTNSSAAPNASTETSPAKPAPAQIQTPAPTVNPVPAQTSVPDVPSSEVSNRQLETKPDEQAPIAQNDGSKAQPEEKKQDAAPATPPADQKAEVQTNEKDPDSGEDPAPFKFEKNYSGDNLTLIHPSENKNNIGHINLKDKDAEKLYETLRARVIATPGDKTWLPGRKKSGFHVVCTKHERRSQKGSTDNSCILHLNFVTGALIQNPSPFLPDFGVTTLKEAYNGPNLKLMFPDNQRTAWIQIKGMDAKALFSTLKSEIVSKPSQSQDYLPAKMKTGKNVICFVHTPAKNPKQPLYACSVNVDFTNGTARAFTHQ